MKERKPPRQIKRIRGHHIIPRTRGGKDDASNVQAIDQSFHRDWHKLFANDMPEEVVAKFLLTWSSTNPFMKYLGNPEIQQDRLSGRKRAWKKVFGDANRDECIEIVIKQFGRGREEVLRNLVRTFDGLSIKNGKNNKSPH